MTQTPVRTADRATRSRTVTISGSATARGQWRKLARSFRELAAVPLLVVLGFVVLAAVSIVADETTTVPVLDDLRSVVGSVVGKDAASSTLQAVATGLVTVASITFSVLLLAVQQTASSLSPVVFDQFMRRRSNQAFLGFFVGLALFAYVVMAAVEDKTPPILGAAVATVLTMGALLILLVLVYSTIDQMRPTNVLRTIHDRALAAREREADVVRMTRRHSRSSHPVRARFVSHTTGWVTGLDHRRLRSVLEGTDADVEVVLHATIGDHVAYGDVIAEVHDGDVERAESIAREVAHALEIGRQRDLGNDASTGVDQLANIAWTSTSSAKHNPEIAREALFALKDLAVRWIEDDPAAPDGDDAPIAIVYADGDLDRVVDWLYSLFLAAYESKEHMISADVLQVYGALLDRTDGALRERLLRDLHAVQPVLDDMPASPPLTAARRQLEEHLDR